MTNIDNTDAKKVDQHHSNWMNVHGAHAKEKFSYTLTRCSTFKPQPIAQKAKLGCPIFFPRNNPSYGQALCG